MANNTCSICEETFDKCDCAKEYEGINVEVAALMQEVRVLRAVLETTQETRDECLRLNNVKAERIVALEQSRARAVWAFRRMRQAAEHWSEAHSRELARAEYMRPVVDAARNTVKTWQFLCYCVDEFGAGSEYCSEQTDAVDKRIIEMRTALATSDAALKAVEQ